MVLKSGEVAASAVGQAGPVSTVTMLEGGGSLFERIHPDEVFACTTCRACDEICPVNIEIVDRILDMRRYLTLMESEFPTELGKAFVAMENQSNPWGLSQTDRAHWTSELDFEIPVFGENGKTTAEYLWFVGCAGSFDDRNTAVSVSLARLLHAREALREAVPDGDELRLPLAARRQRVHAIRGERVSETANGGPDGDHARLRDREAERQGLAGDV